MHYISRAIGFEDFKNLATTDNLTLNQKVDFPDEYRQDFIEIIFNDILKKTTNLDLDNKKVLEIGPGCSDLPKLMIKHCEAHNHRLVMVDSKEMLDLLPNSPVLQKVSGRYPDCFDEILKIEVKFDVIVCYSVLQYIFRECNFFDFIDMSLSLLSSGGQMLIGDIPHVSKRKRFFSSETGIKFHQNFMKTTDVPEVVFPRVEQGKIDDSVIVSLLLRARNQGFDSYVLPQPVTLPMSNRREDILFSKP